MPLFKEKYKLRIWIKNIERLNLEIVIDEKTDGTYIMETFEKNKNTAPNGNIWWFKQSPATQKTLVGSYFEDIYFAEAFDCMVKK